MYSLLRPLLFQLNPELAHDVVLASLRLLPSALFEQDIPLNPKQVMGVLFSNPVGLAAGLDKNAEYIDALGALGFGFIEVGTVTPKPQAGNDKPRLFRLPEHQAIINRMGFNNKGINYVVSKLAKTKYKGVIGVNIGKNRDTPVEEAAKDYLLCLRKVYPYAGYIAINISSPNTPGLRGLQYGDRLKNLLSQLKDEQSRLAAQTGKYVPLAVKIAPDISDEELKHMAETFLEFHIDGVIATNTTPRRDGVEKDPLSEEIGGLSGKPLFKPSTHMVKTLHALLQDKIPIIAVGGIISGDDARIKMRAGASLVQVYTGLIYQGPGLVSDIAESLAN